MDIPKSNTQQQSGYSPAFIHVLYAVLFLQIILILILMYETYLFKIYTQNINDIYVSQFRILSSEHKLFVDSSAKDIMNISFKSNVNTALLVFASGIIVTVIVILKCF